MATPHDAPPADEGASSQNHSHDYWRDLKSTPLTFSGKTWEYFQLWLANLALVVATCGIYTPWARVRSRQYFLAQTRLGGTGFEYRVNPRALLLGWFVFGIGLSLIGTFSDLIASALASAFLPSSRRLWGVALLSLSVGLVLQWVILSWLIVQSMRYNASRTLFRNLHFGFGSKQEQRSLWRELMRLLALAAPAPAIGLLAAYGESERWFAPLALLLLLGIGMAGLLATVWSCWLEAAAARLTWRSIRLGPLHFHCTWAAMELLKLRLTNSLALLFSLGLAWPWVRIRTSRYRLEGILISPAGALEGFLGGEVEQVSALAEGAFSMEDSLAGVIDISF